MLGIENFWLFVISGITLNLIPGPDSLLIAGRGASQGFKAGSVAALGIGTGTLIHIFAAALGLSAILATSATAFTVVKWIGGAYLIYMAVGMYRDSTSPATASIAPKRAMLKRIYAEGFITNVFNPKVAIFFLAFVPQFISASSDNKALAFIVLGLVFNINAMIWAHIIAFVSSTISQKLKVNQTLRKVLLRLSAGLFGVFGLRLLVATQNS
uniref:LysE family translocator n=1 Tax=Thaumasiovibrio occultus TaxID=1891184 RepID=UPI000B360DEC|nr:LysE family translocator [Thaumasiovibrio occultus]